MNVLPIGTKGCWPCKAGEEEEEGEDDDDVVWCCFRTWGERGMRSGILFLVLNV